MSLNIPLVILKLLFQSDDHSKLFESQYKHFGATALRLQVFEFLLQMLTSSVFSVCIKK